LSKRFKAIIANWLKLAGEQFKELIFLNALFPEALDDLKPLFGAEARIKKRKILKP
jgi:hypothetical protein